MLFVQNGAKMPLMHANHRGRFGYTVHYFLLNVLLILAFIHSTSPHRNFVYSLAFLGILAMA